MSQRDQIEQAMAAIESQRGVLGDTVVDTALFVFREKLAGFNKERSPDEVVSPESGLRRFVTILFAEITGLNEMTETVDLEEVRDIANQIWLRLDAILLRFGGVIDKHAGDTVMAIFGAANEEAHAEQAVRAALDMTEEVMRFCAEESVTKIQVRVGINSGFVMLSLIGQNREFTAFGETVNLASRLQTASPPGEVWISHSTFLAVRGIFDILTLDLLQVKGKEEPIQVFRVRGIRPRAFRLSLAAGRIAQTVGRENELAVLLNQYEKTIASRTVVAVSLQGEIGIGKTRLMHEFIRRLDTQGEPFILFRGRADPGKNQTPHALLRDLLAFRFKVMESDTPSEARQKLVRGVEEWMGLEIIETVHWIGHLAGYDFSHSPYLMDQLNSPPRSRQQALNSLRRFISAVAAHTPLLIVLDDLNWADESSLDALESLLQAGVTGPVFILAAFRPEMFSRRSSWVSKCSSVVDLQPLPRIESMLLTNLSLRAGLGLESSRKPTGSLNGKFGQIISQIVENSGGNPLFIEETVQLIFESGIVQVAGRYLPGESKAPWKVDPAKFDLRLIPSDLDAAFQSRLEYIPQDERKVLRAAAVIGHVFWESAVRYILEMDGKETGTKNGNIGWFDSFDHSQAISALLSRGILFRREISAFNQSDEYVFASDQLCRFVYAGLPIQVREEYHLLAANWLVDAGKARVSETRRESLAPVIALHFEKAGKFGESSGWYSRAAHHALNTSAPAAATNFFIRALDLLPQEPVYYANRVHLLKELWNTYWWMGNHPAALSSARSMLDLARERSDSASQAAALNRIAAIQNLQGDYQEALAVVQQAERLARPAKAAHEVVMALFNRGTSLFGLGNADEALHAGEQALAFQRSLVGSREFERDGIGSDDEELIRILNLLGMIHQRAGRLNQAKEIYRQILEVAREKDDRPGMATALISLGSVAHLGGDPSEAARFFREALIISRDLERSDLEMICLSHLAWTQVEEGMYLEADANLVEVIRNINDTEYDLLAETRRLMALSALAQNHFPEAVRYGLLALEHAHQGKSNEQIGAVWRVLGRIAAYANSQMGQRTLQIEGKGWDAHSCYAASLQAFIEIGAAGEQARTVREWAEYEIQQGSPREGARLWQEARSLFERLGMQSEVEWMDRHPKNHS
jgi:class 3 adenylate cyclase/tetratricopeptide (TPR) repeat protein